MAVVSVIVPTNERTALLMGRCLPSIVAQTFTDWEALVVGEPGSPETIDAMATVTDPRISFSSVPRPPYPDDPLDAWAISWYAAVAYGFDHAQGEWVTILCDDDELRPRCFETLLGKSDGVDLVYGLSERRVGRNAYIMGLDYPPRFDDHVIGSHIQRRTDSFLRPDPKSIERGMTPDGEWWQRMFETVPYARVKQVVHIYHQALERYHWGPAFYGKEPRP